MVLNSLSKVWQDPRYFIAFGFGSGLLPLLPGTWGTLAAIPLYLILVGLSPLYYLVVVSLFFFLGVYVADKVSAELGLEDYSGIVCDEMVGFLLALWGLPLHLGFIILGFILFRLFDIWKPWPISFIDKKVKGGFGIMLDDVLAALPVWLILQSLAWLFSS